MKSAAAAIMALLSLLVGAPLPAGAGFSAAQLNEVSAAPPPNAALPLALGFVDDKGKPRTLGDAVGGVPAVLIFADYTCHTLCGPILEFAAAGLAKTALRPGADYHLIVIGLDPKDGLGTARAMRATHFDAGNPINTATDFLSGSEAAIHGAAAALGLHYAYDAEHDQFAHPAAVYVVDARGRVVRVLSALGMDGADLRLAIVDAGHGTIGTFADRIHQLCYGYDPVRGIYTERITTALAIAAGVTLFAVMASIGLMAVRERRKVPS
jgi:protein SCO1